MAKETYFVCVVNGRPYDSYAAFTALSSIVLASPDEGDTITIWQCEAYDGGAARLPSTYTTGKLLLEDQTLAAAHALLRNS